MVLGISIPLQAVKWAVPDIDRRAVNIVAVALLEEEKAVVGTIPRVH
jgi:hypothetical protein